MSLLIVVSINFDLIALIKLIKFSVTVMSTRQLSNAESSNRILDEAFIKIVISRTHARGEKVFLLP